jgi:hypothetical protein
MELKYSGQTPLKNKETSNMLTLISFETNFRKALKPRAHYIIGHFKITGSSRVELKPTDHYLLSHLTHSRQSEIFTSEIEFYAYLSHLSISAYLSTASISAYLAIYLSRRI